MCQQNVNNKRRQESKANCKLTACVGNRMASSARRPTSILFIALGVSHSFRASQDQCYAKNSLLSKRLDFSRVLFPQLESLRWFWKATGSRNKVAKLEIWSWFCCRSCLCHTVKPGHFLPQCHLLSFRDKVLFTV